MLSDVIGPPSNPPVEPEQDTSNRAGPSSILEPGSEVTLVDPFGCQIESSLPEEDGELVADFLPVPDDGEFPGGDLTSYFVKDTETYVIRSEVEEEGDDEDMDDCLEEDPTMMMSNRQSTLTSFTGASLLGSPRNSVFGVSSVASPVEDGAVDLLSPVQLSIKLYPFPIPPLDSKVRRGDSIDSGYADGDSWVSPLPFPRSPPGSFRSSVTFLSHSRRASRSSPALQDRRVSYDVSALRRIPHNPIEVIKEVEPDGGPGDNEDVAYTILGAYDASPSEEQGASDPLQVIIPVVAEESAEEDDGLPEVPAVMRSLRRYSPEHLHPTKEYDLDSCNQPSDDNLSFKTALSTQPSYENLSDVSKVSPVKNDSIFSSISGSSTPNTSVLSYYDDANELLEQSTFALHVHESSYLVAMTGMASQIDSPGVSDASAPGECSLLEEVTIDSNAPFASGSTDGHQGVAPEKALAALPLFEDFRLDRRSLVSSPSLDTFHSLSSAGDILGCVPLGAGDLRESVPEDVIPRERLSGAFHFNTHPPKSSTSAYSPHLVKNTSVPPRADDFQELAPVVVAPRERFPAILHHERPSSSSSPESSYSPSSCTDVLDYAVAGAGDIPESTPENVVALQERLFGVLHFNKFSPKPSLSAEPSYSPFSVKDVLVYAPSDTDGNDTKSPEPSPTVLHGYLTERAAAEADQSLVADSLGSDEITETFDSESDDFTQRLSFPLPPPFFPAEFVGHSTLNGRDTSVVPEAAVANLEKDVSDACTVLQHEDVRQILSVSDLTEKAKPSQLPSVGSPNSNSGFTLQRSRAASDLTVKGRSSPVTTLVDTSYISRSSPPLAEQPGRSDSVQSLYDHYFDDGTSDGGSEFSSPVHKDAAPPDASRSIEEPYEDVHPRSVDHTSHVFHRVFSPLSDSETSNSGTSSPQSETALRPLWTGRRLPLPSFLTELVPKANPINAKQSSSPTHPPTRLQVREIGSTMVPLGFRRHKPRVCNQL